MALAAYSTVKWGKATHVCRHLPWRFAGLAVRIGVNQSRLGW
jgi:hypothetical protein